MQVLTAPLRALLFCFDFFSDKPSSVKSSMVSLRGKAKVAYQDRATHHALESHFSAERERFASLLKYKIQDVTPSVHDPFCAGRDHEDKINKQRHECVALVLFTPSCGVG